MKAIDGTRVKKTKGGHEVRIYATDGNSHYPIHGAWRVGAGHWIIGCWTSEGLVRHGAVSDLDLVEEPETVDVDVWLNVRKDGSSVRWESREQADRNASNDRFACINIKRTVTKSEGLDGT